MFTKNWLFVSMLLFSITVNAISAELMPGRSSYSYRLNVLDCNNLEPLKGCRHEIGHKMDDDLGMPSLSTEFAIATQAHLIYEMSTLEVPDDTAILIRLYPDRDPREIYAALYTGVEGDIEKLPSSLQPFYSKEHSYLRLYDCLAKAGLNICGLSVSYLKGEN